MLANIESSSQVNTAMIPLLLCSELKGGILEFAGGWKGSIGSPFAQPKDIQGLRVVVVDLHLIICEFQPGVAFGRPWEKEIDLLLELQVVDSLSPALAYSAGDIEECCWSEHTDGECGPIFGGEVGAEELR